MAQAEADGSYGPFWPDLHPDCLQIQNLQNFPLYLLREGKEGKSPPWDVSLVMRPFKIPKQRKGTGGQKDQGREEKDARDREESLTAPLLSGPSQPKPALASGTMASPLGQGARRRGGGL